MSNIDSLANSPQIVVPAKAGVQNILKLLDIPDQVRNDKTWVIRLFTGSSILINIKEY